MILTQHIRGIKYTIHSGLTERDFMNSEHTYVLKARNHGETINSFILKMKDNTKDKKKRNILINRFRRFINQTERNGK